MLKNMVTSRYPVKAKTECLSQLARIGESYVALSCKDTCKKLPLIQAATYWRAPASPALSPSAAPPACAGFRGFGLSA